MHALFHTSERVEERVEKRYSSGDIAPGSPEAPQILPRAATPDSLADTVSWAISIVFRMDDMEKRRFGYEGKESDVRRPERIRHRVSRSA